jgi:hypothetical protein
MALKLRSISGGVGGKKGVQIPMKHDTYGGLIIGGIALSLLSALGFAVNRALHALKGRKVASMSRNAYSSRSLSCAPASGGTVSVKAKQTDERHKPCEEEIRDEIPVHQTAKRLIKVMGFVRVGGRLERPPVDDQLVYLDE